MSTLDKLPNPFMGMSQQMITTIQYVTDEPPLDVSHIELNVDAKPVKVKRKTKVKKGK